MRITSVSNPTISIPSPSLHRRRPSSSSTGSVITFRRRRSSPRLTVRYQALGFDGHDDEHFSKSSIKYWDKFYKRHQNKFFKDRHYLEKDWGQYFSDDNTISPNGKVVLEVGCGAGNTIFPLLAAYPKLFVHACDFSDHAVTLVKLHTSFNEDRVNVFVCDIASDDLCHHIMPSSVDVITLFLQIRCIS